MTIYDSSFFAASFGTDHQLTEIIKINNSNSYEMTIIIFK